MFWIVLIEVRDSSRKFLFNFLETIFPKFSIAGWKMAFPHSNPAVTGQRLRLEALLRQLGAPETPPDDKVQTGLAR